MDSAEKAGARAVIWTLGWLLLPLLLQEGWSAARRGQRGQSGGSREEGPPSPYRAGWGKDLHHGHRGLGKSSSILSRGGYRKSAHPRQRGLWKGFLPRGAVGKFFHP